MPRRSLVELVQASPDKLTVKEAIFSLKRLHDLQYSQILEITQLIRNERHRCDIEDLHELAVLNLPTMAGNFVNEIMRRYESNVKSITLHAMKQSFRALVGATDTPTPSVSSSGAVNRFDDDGVGDGVDDEELDEDEDEDGDETLAVVFPSRMAECYTEIAVGRHVLGCGPLIHMPPLQSDGKRWRLHVRNIIWTPTDTSMFQIVLMQHLRDGDGIAITITGDAKGISLGTLSNASPSVAVPMSLLQKFAKSLATFTIDAVICQQVRSPHMDTSVVSDTDMTAKESPDTVGDGTTGVARGDGDGDDQRERRRDCAMVITS